MDKRFWISAVVAFLIIFTVSWLVHGMLLHDEYAKLPQLFRPQPEISARFPYMVIAYLLLAFSFTWIYRQGISVDRPWLIQGFKFGLAAALLAPAPMYLIYYVIQPMDGATVVKQILGDGSMLVITGVAVAFINRSEAAITT